MIEVYFNFFQMLQWKQFEMNYKCTINQTSLCNGHFHGPSFIKPFQKSMVGSISLYFIFPISKFCFKMGTGKITYKKNWEIAMVFRD